MNYKEIEDCIDKVAALFDYSKLVWRLVSLDDNEALIKSDNYYWHRVKSFIEDYHMSDIGKKAFIEIATNKLFESEERKQLIDKMIIVELNKPFIVIIELDDINKLKMDFNKFD